jgi:twinkle protein
VSDITEISRLLSSRAQSVAEYLLPRGRKEGQEWRVGSVDGEPGQSLGVHLSGSKAGVWAEFNSGEAGDLLDLWQQARRVSLSQALSEAREWLGISRPEPYREPKKEYARPPKPNCSAPANKVRDYLVEVRNIPADVITKFRIGEAGEDIIFPFLLPDGTLAMAKSRKAADGEKPKPTSANCEPVLFGWQAMPESAREVVITEGEIDALSWAAYGVAAMSVPYGGGGGAKQRWIESEFERMDRFEKIYIATDMDKEGDAAAVEIASRLGRHRCMRVKMPFKDANECLVNGLSEKDMLELLAGAAHLDPEGLRRATDFSDKVVELFWPSHDGLVGYRTPYKKLGDKLLFRPAELTLWTGISGDGKSQILSDCMVDWISQGSRVCLSSLEMHPAQSLKRMCKQTVGVDRPTERAIRAALAWLDQGLLLYEKVGKSGVKGLLEIFSFARAKYGCDQFVIDSLMRLGVDQDDYTAQEKALFDLVDWTLANNVHVHLVAHSRKGDKDRGVPETGDIKGAMEIGANAFNIIGVWRNRKQEDQVKAAASDEERDMLNEKPGVILNVAKQRNGDFEGKIGLWFNQENYQYQSSYDRSEWNRRYLPRGEAA